MGTTSQCIAANLLVGVDLAAFCFKVLVYTLGCMPVPSQVKPASVLRLYHASYTFQHWLRCLVQNSKKHKSIGKLKSFCRYRETHFMASHAYADAGFVMSQHARTEGNKG